LSKSFSIDYKVTNNREARAEEAIQVLKLSAHNLEKGFLLDIGCGNGSTTKWFSNNLGVYSVGLDVHEGFADGAKTHNPLLEYAFASGIRLPFKEKSFHTVILNDVLEHVSYHDAKELFDQIQKVLDDDGVLYVSVASKFEIREPHSNLLFMSWFPRWVYSPVVRKIHREDVYPYTFMRFKILAESTDFYSENFTRLYVLRKVQNLNYIGNKMVRPIARILNKMGLTKNAGFLKFLEPFGVLIFVCRKRA
jgi:ubiquinone/menaquinone biosynthesis C-methylase UbiE